MLKQQAVLEVKVGERVYNLSLDALSPLGEVYDALCQMKGYIVQRMVDEQKASDAQKAPEVPSQSEEVKPEQAVS